MSEQTEQPKATPSAKPKYTLDDAGVLSRVVGIETTALAIYKDGIVTILSGMVEYQPNVLRVLERMGKKIERIEYAPAVEVVPAVVTPTAEPATEPHLGQRTPAWLAWCKQADPKRYAAVCERLKISDQP
jgi:hypothetical protein